MTAYFAYAYDQLPFKVPGWAARTTMHWNKLDIGDFYDPVPEDLKTHSAILMCGMTNELQASCQKSKVKKISPFFESDTLVIHYVRIKMLTQQTISLICVAPLRGWWGGQIPRFALWLEDWMAPPGPVQENQNIYEAGWQYGWFPLSDQAWPQGISMNLLANDVISKGSNKSAWFEQSVTGGVRPIERMFYTERGRAA